MSTEEHTHPSLTLLIEKRDQLNQAIAAVEGLVKIASGADFIESAIKTIVAKSLGSMPIGGSEDGTTDDGAEEASIIIRSDQFFGKSVMDATVEYLGLMKKPRSAQEIIDAIKSGGYLFQTNNPAPSVTSTLNRSHTNGGQVVRVGKNMFGLAEWYAGRGRIKKKSLGNDQSESTNDEGDDDDNQADEADS